MQRYNIGWGLTNLCNMNCQFCYSKSARQELTDATINDEEQGMLDATYEDYFFILKSALEENIKVSMDGTELETETDNIISFDDIGESISLQIENPDNFIVQTTRNSNVSASIEGDTITLTSLSVPRQESSITLYIGTKTFVLKFSIKAKAEYLEVSCAQ